MGKLFFKSREPMHPCPKCSHRAFGVLSVHPLSFTRRCNDCDFSQNFDLPALQKKIVYLDQMAISLLVKVDHGRAPAQWRKVREAIERARRLEAIVIPYSEFHERESVADRVFADKLKKLYQQLAMGVSYRRTHFVQQFQVLEGLRLFEKMPEQEPRPRWADILDTDPNVWTEDFFITVNMPDVLNEGARFQEIKSQITKEVVALNETFHRTKATFDEQFAMEQREAGLNVWNLYRQDHERLRASSSPEEAFEAIMMGSSFSDTARIIIDFLRDRGYRGNPLSLKFADFLVSPEFKALDYVRVESALLAGLAMRVKGGRGKVTANDFIDISAISYYAPYCDAMFIDKAMYDLVMSRPVQDRIGLETKFFCARTIDAFVEYLHEVQRQVPADIIAAIDLIHGKK